MAKRELKERKDSAYKEWPLYVDNERTVRVANETEYTSLARRIRRKIIEHGMAEVSFMGHCPAWEKDLGLAFLSWRYIVHCRFHMVNVLSPTGEKLRAVVVDVFPGSDTEED